MKNWGRRDCSLCAAAAALQRDDGTKKMVSVVVVGRGRGMGSEEEAI